MLMASVAIAPEELERHHRHLQLADPPDVRTALVDADGDDEIGVAGLAADEADEREVEDARLPVADLAVPDLGRARSCRRRRSPG